MRSGLMQTVWKGARNGMRKIVVFGATGDIGRYFVRHLKDNIGGNAYEIYGVGRKTGFYEPGIRYCPVDITRRAEFGALPRDIYAVVMLAGHMPARMEGYEPQKYIDVNITGTLNVLDYCLAAGADRILYCHSFGDIKDAAEKDIVLRVDARRSFNFSNDHSVYVLTKDFAVDLIENYHKTYGIKRFVFRLPTIYMYSPIDYYYVDGRKTKVGYRLLIERALEGRPIEVWGDPQRKKDMVYVKDLCQMLFKAIDVSLDRGFYNVGTGKGTSLIDQINGIIDVFSREGRRSEIVLRPDMPDAPQYIMDIKEAEKELGYEPAYDYMKMLKDIKKIGWGGNGRHVNVSHPIPCGAQADITWAAA